MRDCRDWETGQWDEGGRAWDALLQGGRDAEVAPRGGAVARAIAPARGADPVRTGGWRRAERGAGGVEKTRWRYHVASYAADVRPPGFPAMPIYAFECATCGHAFDRLQRLADADPTECPECSAATIRRQLTAPSFRLAGSGWYETDFKKDGDRKRNLADAPRSEGKPEGKTESKSESKSEGKAEGKADSGSKSSDARPADSKASTSASTKPAASGS